MNFHQLFLFLFIFSFVATVSRAEAVIVLKSKNKHVLLYLDGLKTKKGAYFVAIDFYGQKKALVEIKRVAQTKAIGVIKFGVVSPKWSLEAMSQKKAIAVSKKIKKRLLLAEKKKELEWKLEEKKRLAERKKELKRKLATSEGGEMLGDLSEDNSLQSEEVLSYDSPAPEPDPALQSAQKYYDRKDLSDGIKRFVIGVSPFVAYSFMNVTPLGAQPKYLMSGLNTGASFFFELALNRFMSVQWNLGYNWFRVGADEDKCGISGGCNINIHYGTMAGHLKLSLVEFYSHRFWLTLGGELLQPLLYSNNILTKNSFSPFHGKLGGGLGLDLRWGAFVMPLSILGHVYIPPTQTTLTSTVSAQIGFAYRF